MQFPAPVEINEHDLLATASPGGPYVLPQKRLGPITDFLRGERHESIEQECYAVVCETVDPYLNYDGIVDVRSDGMVVVRQWNISRAARASLLEQSVGRMECPK